MEEYSISPALQAANTAFYNLMQREAFIPNKIKNAIDSALKGLPLPLAKEMQEYIRIEITEVMGSLNELNNNGFNVNEKDYEDLLTTEWCCEELITCSLRHTYGWGLPSEESISMIVQKLESFSGLLEIGAGSGLWSKIISMRTDKEIIACELNLRSDTPRPKYYDVKNEAGEILMEKYPDYPILIVWADINDMSIKMADKLEKENYLFLVGPPRVTGNDVFYDYIDRNFALEKIYNASSFSGGIDQLFILKKLPEPKLEHEMDNFFSNERNGDNIKKLMNKVRMK